jgi:NAD(P)-dependent dehydrogenase (short-subunit alcohol dehydrogenase family)
MVAFAERVFGELGGAHVVCNNAGVVAFKPVQVMTEADWDWVLGVDLMGVVNGVYAFTSRMVAQKQGGHFVNTASIAGAVPMGGIGSYTTAKNGVVGLTETMAIDLASENIGASVLCPGLVRTRIADSARSRPDEYGGPVVAGEAVQANINQVGIDPMGVAALVLRAVKENQLYIFTHQEYRAQVEARFKAMLAAHDWAGIGPR